METPVVKMSMSDAETVYEPSEDSFLLIDALEADLVRFKSTKPLICLDIGSGSGIVVTALALAAGRCWSSYFVAVDINPNACRVTKRTSIQNCTNVDVVEMDLVSAIYSQNIFDLIVFNPPYVETDSSEVLDERPITRSWAGGKKGREVMDRIFARIPCLLSDTGLFYLVVVSENDPSEIITIFESFNMKGEIVCERKVRGEHLHVLRFEKI